MREIKEKIKMNINFIKIEHVIKTCLFLLKIT